MDDRKVYALTRLKLAYQKQIVFISGLIVLTLIGVSLYIFTIYQFNLGLLMVSVAIVITGLAGIITIDQKLKLISKKIKELE